MFVKPMKADDTPTDNAPATHLSSSKLELNWKSLVMEIPITVENAWPRIMLRGWASGESRALNSRIAAAPWKVSVVSKVAYCMSAYAFEKAYKTSYYDGSSMRTYGFTVKYCFYDCDASNGPYARPETREDAPDRGSWG